jgi:hypothetical protein
MLSRQREESALAFFPLTVYIAPIVRIINMPLIVPALGGANNKYKQQMKILHGIKAFRP